MHSANHIHVLVNIRLRKGLESIEYYVVPSKIVAAKMHSSKRAKSEWHQFNRVDAKRYLNDWAQLGVPRAPTSRLKRVGWCGNCGPAYMLAVVPTINITEDAKKWTLPRCGRYKRR